MKAQCAFVGDADHSVPCRNYEMRTGLVIRAVGTLGSACPTAERSAQTSIPNIIKAFKHLTNKEAGEKMWQKSYYDHVIRSNEDFLTCAQYIETNPLRYLLKQE